MKTPAVVASCALLLLAGTRAPALAGGIEDLDREHLLMLMGGGLETWKNADAEILIGAVPWFVELFVTVPEDIVIRASRVQARGGGAVVTLRGGEQRLEEIFGQLTREGWARRATIVRTREPLPAAPHLLEHLVPAGVFCRGDASLVVWKARETAEGLDLKVSFTNSSLSCRQEVPGDLGRRSSLADPGPWPSVIDDPAVRTLLDVAPPNGGSVVNALGGRNDAWSEWFTIFYGESSAADSLAHYEAQLRKRGWIAIDRRDGPGISVASFEIPNGAAKRRAMITLTEDAGSPTRKTLALRFDSAPR